MSEFLRLLPVSVVPDRGAPHAPYFAALERELRERGPGKPILLLDRDALDRNLATVRRRTAFGVALRVVAKSLPSVPLLRHVLEGLATNRLMVFDESVTELSAFFPEADILLGKPLPERAIDRFYEQHGSAGGERVQWLVDDGARLARLQAQARRLGVRLRVSLEVDVGLHRGGFASPDALSSALSSIAADPAHLRFAGLMGYDAHVAAAPPLLSSPERAHRVSVERYAAFARAVRDHDITWAANATFNGGGSKTYALHRADGPVGEVALGSALVMPTDFDVPTLASHQPALFLAAPVLKRLEGTRIPYLDRLSAAWSRIDPNRQVTYFLFGGGWMAKPFSPEGLIRNPLYGTSTNQSLLNGSRRTALEPESSVFFRPTQSERVMQELGSLHLVRGGKLAGTWEVLPFTP